LPKEKQTQSNDEFPTNPDTLICYVDGSYDHSLGRYAFGCVFLLPDHTLLVESGSGNDPQSLPLRNVSGEMIGAMFALRFALHNQFSQVEIRYDYDGIEKWVTGAWKAKKERTQQYRAAMNDWAKHIRLRFTKVAAHANVYYNEMVDKVAKQALTQKDAIPRVRTIEQMKAEQNDI
jgi:ribonuclease HI